MMLLTMINEPILLVCTQTFRYGENKPLPMFGHTYEVCVVAQIDGKHYLGFYGFGRATLYPAEWFITQERYAEAEQAVKHLMQELNLKTHKI